MFEEYFSVIAQGIPTSLGLTAVSLVIAFLMAIGFTFVLSMENRWFKAIVNGYLTLFTGTPLLVQFFLIYHGPGQFQWLVDSPFWNLFSDAWFCAALALALNSAAYSTQLFHGAVKLPSYSNEIILVFKGTSLASTITILDIMGYAKQLNGTEYNALAIFGLAGAIYLVITGVMTLVLRQVEKKVLAFENPMLSTK